MAEASLDASGVLLEDTPTRAKAKLSRGC